MSGRGSAGKGSRKKNTLKGREGKYSVETLFYPAKGGLNATTLQMAVKCKDFGGGGGSNMR